VRNSKINLKATVTSRGAATSYLKQPGDTVIVDRQGPRWLLLSCPCGCREELPINLDSRAGPAWRLYQNTKTGLSLYPSIWRKTGCKSHFIIWRNRIDLFVPLRRTHSDQAEIYEIGSIAEAVRELLPKHDLVPFVVIADALNAIPWDVLTVCRQLVDGGIAREGTEKSRGHFGLA